MAAKLAVLWALGLGIFFALVHQESLDGQLQNLQAILAALTLLTASMGLGAQILHKRTELRWDVCLIVGLLIWGTILLPLAWLGILRWAIVLLLPMMYLGWKHRSTIQWPQLTAFDWPILFFGCIVLWLTLQPSMDTDALYYHLSLPKQMWMQNQLLGGELRPNGSRPMLFHLPLTHLYALGTEQAINVFAGFISMAFLGSLIERSETIRSGAGWIVLLCLLGSYSYWGQSTITANNILAGFAVWLAFWASQKDEKGVLGLLCGLAVAVKFTSVGVIGAIWLLAKMPWQRKLQECGVAGVLLVVWFIRNWLDGYHPLFPYAGWEGDFPFLFVEKYGMGRDWGAMLMLPWNVIMHAEVDQFQFLGRLSPLFLFLLPFGIWKVFHHPMARKILVINGVAFVFWALGPHWIRHLFPLLGMLVFSLAISINWNNKLNKAGVLLVFVLGIQANWIPFIKGKVPYITEETAEQIPGLKAMQWINDHTEQNTKVALLFAWTGSVLNRSYVLGSVEDHTPIRHWIYTRGEQSLSDLQAEGVEYLVVGPHRFIRKTYSFLSDQEFEVQFQKPVQFIDELLLKEARLVYTAKGYSIYHLPLDKEE